MLFGRQTAIGEQVKCKVANAQATSAGVAKVLTAGATEDGVEVTGETVDRMNTSAGAMAQSCVLAIPYLASLAAAKTIAFKVDIQDSADGSTWNTAEAVQASTVAATGTAGTGSNEAGVVEKEINLSQYERYIRFNITPDLSATGTDTAVWSAVCALGGYDYVPAA